MGSGSASTQSRLIDYLVVGGVRKPTVDSTETRLLLRRFPQKDHKDCVSPGDVVFLSTGRMQCCIEKVFFARSELVGVYVDWKWFLQGCYGICVLTLKCVSTLFELYSQERNDCRGRILTVRKMSRHRRDCCMISASSILSDIQGVPIFPSQDDRLEDGNYREIGQKRQPSSRLE